MGLLRNIKKDYIICGLIIALYYANFISKDMALGIFIGGAVVHLMDMLNKRSN